MKKSIPLDVSSTLGTISTDTPIAATPYANATGVTTEKAPVLIAVRSTATVTAEEFATRMVKAGGQGTEAQARLALNAVAAVLGELVEEYGAITVNTPFGTIQTFIAGTLESAQDAPDPETNRAFLGVVVPETYRRQFARMTAYVPTGACPAALKRVRDKATNAKGIRGASPFYLEGRGMTIGGEGETLELLDAATRDKLCDIAVDAESKSPVQFLCTLSPQAAIEAGTYLLRLTTLAGGEATLWPVELKVELLEAAAPTDPYFVEPTDELELAEGGEIVIAGGNLPERSQWNPTDGNSFLTTVVDAAGETVYEEREILDEDLGPATGPDKVVVLGDILKDMIAESAGEEPSPGDVFTVSVWAKTDRGTADEKASNVVTFTAKVPA